MLVLLTYVLFAQLGGAPCDPAVEEVVRRAMPRTRSFDEGERNDAARRLGQLGADALSCLAALLGDSDSQVRADAATALGQHLGDPAQTVRILVQALFDAEPLVRANAAASLGELGDAAESAVPALLFTLSDEDSLPRGFAAKALGKIRPATAETISALLRHFEDPDGNVQYSVVTALGALGSKASDAVPALVAALEREELRHDAAYVLGQIGPKASPAVPELVEQLDSSDLIFRVNVARALWRINSQPEIPVNTMMSVLETSGDEEAKIHAAYGLVEIGAPARQSLPAMYEALGTVSDELNRDLLQQAIGEFGEKLKVRN